MLAKDPADPDATGELLRRIKGGDEAARERLFARCLPRLQRWAHRRLPLEARDIADTDDLVQLTLLRAFRRLDSFDCRGEGAFLAYLRSILFNAIRDELRRRPPTVNAPEVAPPTRPGGEPSELERLIQRDQLDRYEQALAALSERDRCAVVLRLEFDADFHEVAEAIGASGPNAARMAFVRARDRLTRLLQDDPTAA